jgi:hypothetical protein
VARTRGNGLAGKNALTVQIEAPGLDAMIKKLQDEAQFGKTSAKRVRAGMTQTVKLVLGQARQTTPVRSGKMIATLFGQTKVWGEGNVTGNVGVSEAGAKKFALEGGRSAAAKRGELVPRRFLWHAYKKVEEKVDAIWKKVLEQITRDLAGK